MTSDRLSALRPWKAPEVTSWGRLPMNAVDRRCQAVSLDGDWRFQLLPAPDAPLGQAWSSAWTAIEATPGLQSGFIREFRDHGILQRVNDGRPAGRGGAGS
jgi:hypothetical protein